MRPYKLAALLVALPFGAAAEETAAFLKIGLGARAVGMGGAYTAMADDVTAIGWNPGGLASLPKRELGATHAELVAQTRYDFVGYAHPTKHGTFAAGAIYLSQGGLEGRDASGKPTGTFGASDSAVALSYAARLGGPLRLGGSLKYIRSDIAEASGRTFAVDLGGQRDLAAMGPGTPTVGLAVLNMGPRMRFLDEASPLPLTLAAGAGYRLPIGLTLALDLKHRPYAVANEVSVGTEYSIVSSFAVRAGYGTSRALAGSPGGTSAMSGFAAGFGLRLQGYTVDYSMTPFGELGSVQRFSLGARF